MISTFVAFLLTGSSSMLAEAVHSVADSGNQVLLVFAPVGVTTASVTGDARWDGVGALFVGA